MSGFLSPGMTAGLAAGAEGGDVSGEALGKEGVEGLEVGGVKVHAAGPARVGMNGMHA